MDRAELERLLALFERGELSAPLTVARLLLISRDLPGIERWLRDRAAGGALGPSRLLALIEQHRQGCLCVARGTFADQPSGSAAPSVSAPSGSAAPSAGSAAPSAGSAAPSAGSAAPSVSAPSVSAPSVSAPSVSASPSVAGCADKGARLPSSLEGAALLERATRELVERLESWGLLGRAQRTLQLGCGVGRMQKALSGRVRLAAGVDVAPRMIARARARCAGRCDTLLVVADSADLSMFDDASFELVYGVDSFPEIVRAGAAQVSATFTEVSRLLATGGHLLIFNYSDRDDRARDAADIEAHAHRHGFELLGGEEGPFELWKGTVFRLRRLARGG